MKLHDHWFGCTLYFLRSMNTYFKGIKDDVYFSIWKGTLAIMGQYAGLEDLQLWISREEASSCLPTTGCSEGLSSFREDRHGAGRVSHLFAEGEIR